MRLDQVAEAAAGHLLGRFVRRTLVALACAIFALVALYHFTVAGTFALEAQYGALQARLAIGAIYTAAALATLIGLWATRNKGMNGKQLATNRELQMVMLVEAAMLGYALARKREPVR